MPNYWTPQKHTEPRSPAEPRLDFKEVALPAGARFLGANYISSCPASPARQATYHVSEKHLVSAIQASLEAAALAAEKAILLFPSRSIPDPTLLEAVKAAILNSSEDPRHP